VCCERCGWRKHYTAGAPVPAAFWARRYATGAGGATSAGVGDVTHARARAIVLAAWRAVHGREATTNEAELTQAIALHETGYGRLGQFAAMAAAGRFNWGALERPRLADGSCPPGSAPGCDAGDPRCFLVFASDEAAARAFVRLLTASHWPVVAAMATGDPRAVAHAMKAPPAYYTGDESRYGADLEARRREIRAALEGTAPAAPATTPSDDGRGRVIGIGALALAAFGAWRLAR